MKPDASSYSAHGMTVQRPADWLFVAPDATAGADTVVLLQGPVGSATLAPVVEIARRPLTAADQRRRPAHVLTALVTEIVQAFEGFEIHGEPADQEVGGRPGARVELSLIEELSDGAQETRRATFYGVFAGDQLWLVRCMGPADGSAEGSCREIVGSLAL